MRQSSIFDAGLSQAGRTLAPMAASRYPRGDPGSMVQPVRRGSIQTGRTVVLPVQDRQGRSGQR